MVKGCLIIHVIIFLVKDCGSATEDENGSVTYTGGTIFGATAKHSCNNGWEFETCYEDDCSDTQECKIDGWSNKVPPCKSMC